MKIKLLGLLMCSFPCFALTSGGYQVSVSVKDSEQELIFPSLKVPFFDQKVTSQADDCTYSVKITQEDAAAIRLEAQMHCHYKDGDSYMNLPFFVLNSSGQVASVEIGDEDADMWKYSVDVEPLN